MTTREEAEKALALVKALTERAVEIWRVTVKKAWEDGPGRDAHVWVTLNGDQAELSWVYEDHDGGYSVTWDDIATAPLFLPDNEFAKWKAETVDAIERAKRAVEQAEAAKRKAAAAKAERATYERLKAKYEGGG